jgi:hypothetical protein
MVKNQRRGMKKAILLFSPLFLIGLMLVPQAVAAEGGSGTFSTLDGMVESMRETLRSDTFEVVPRYRQELTVDSNILLEPGDEGRLDWIFAEKPGASVSVPFGAHYVEIDYEAWFEQFIKESKENELHQFLNGTLALSFTDFYVTFDNTISHTSSRSGTALTERIPRFENDFDVTVGIPMNRMTLESGYSDFYRSFDSSSLADRSYHSMSLHNRLYVDVTEKTKGFTEYIITRYEYSKGGSRDQWQHEFFGGITGQLLPKTTLFAKFGFGRTDSEDDVREDDNTFLTEIGGLWLISPKTTLDGGWVRSTEQSTFSTVNFLTQDRWYTRLHQKINEKVSGSVQVSYIIQAYEGDTLVGDAGSFDGGERDDHLLDVNAQLLYEFTDWMSADLGYEYRRRDSNASLFDYTTNIVKLGVTVEV